MPGWPVRAAVAQQALMYTQRPRCPAWSCSFSSACPRPTQWIPGFGCEALRFEHKPVAPKHLKPAPRAAPNERSTTRGWPSALVKSATATHSSCRTMLARDAPGLAGARADAEASWRPADGWRLHIASSVGPAGHDPIKSYQDLKEAAWEAYGEAGPPNWISVFLVDSL